MNCRALVGCVAGLQRFEPRHLNIIGKRPSVPFPPPVKSEGNCAEGQKGVPALGRRNVGRLGKSACATRGIPANKSGQQMGNGGPEPAGPPSLPRVRRPPYPMPQKLAEQRRPSPCQGP